MDRVLREAAADCRKPGRLKRQTGGHARRTGGEARYECDRARDPGVEDPGAKDPGAKALVFVVLVCGALLASGCSNAGRAAAPTTVAAKATRAVVPTTTVPAPPATFSGPDGVEARWVIHENKKPGTTSWRLSAAGGAPINGFANLTAASRGDHVSLYVTTEAPRSTT